MYDLPSTLNMYIGMFDGAHRFESRKELLNYLSDHKDLVKGYLNLLKFNQEAIGEDRELNREIVLLGKNLGVASDELLAAVGAVARATPLFSTAPPAAAAPRALPVRAVKERSLQEMTTEKNLANLLSDSFMKERRGEGGEKLEGNSFLESMQYMRALLREEIKGERSSLADCLLRDKGEEIKHLEEQLGRCVQWLQHLERVRAAPQQEKHRLLQEIVAHTERSIAALAVGGSLLLPSGWVEEEGGHAMLSLIRRTSPEKYEILLINTGDGTQYHDFSPTAEKSYISPVQAYGELALEELCDHAFLQAYYEPSLQASGEKNHYEAKDLYEGIFSRFPRKEVDPSEQLLVTAQRSGSCSVRVLLAYAHFSLKSEAYKPLVYLLKKRALSEAVIRRGSSIEEKPVTAEILERGGESLSRALLKLNRREGALYPLSDEELMEGRKTIAAVKECAAKAPAAIGVKAPDFSLPELLPTKKVAIDLSPSSLPAPLPSAAIAVTSLQPAPLDRIAGLRGAALIKELALYRAALKEENALSDGGRRATLHKASMLLNSLPLPGEESSLWSDLAPKERSAAIEELYAIAQLLMEAMAQEPVAFIDRMTAIYQTLAVVHHLAASMENEEEKSKPPLAAMGVAAAPLKALLGNVHNVPREGAAAAKVEQLIAYFEKSHPAPATASLTLFDYPSWESRYDAIELPLPLESGEYSYLKKFYSPDAKWVAREKGFHREYCREARKEISLEEWCIARLWTGKGGEPAVPRSFLLLRNLSLYAQLIANPPAGEAIKKIDFSAVEEFAQLDIDKCTGGLVYATEEYISFPTFPKTVSAAEEPYPKNSYPETHFPIKSSEKTRLLAPDEGQNHCIVKYGKHLEPFYAATIEPTLSHDHGKNLLELPLEELLEKENQAFLSLTLLDYKKLQRAIVENPHLSTLYFEKIDRKISEIRLMLTAAKGKMGDAGGIERIERLKGGELSLLNLRLRLLQTMHETAIEGKASFPCDVEREILFVREQLEGEISRMTLSPAIERAFRLAYVAAFSTMPPANEEEIASLMEHYFFAEFHNSERSESDPAVEESAHRVFLSNHSKFIDTFADRTKLSSLVDRILLEVYGFRIEGEKRWQYDAPVYRCETKNGLLTVNFSTREVRREGALLTNSVEIYDHPDYKFALGERRFLSATLLSSQNGLRRVELVDSEGEALSLAYPTAGKEKKRGEMAIARSVAGKVLHYLPWEAVGLECTLPSLPKIPNRDHYVLWADREGGLLHLCERGSRETVMVCDGEGALFFPQEQKRGRWADISQAAGLEALAKFGDERHTAAIKGDGSALEVSFCNYLDERGTPLTFSEKEVEVVDLKGEKRLEKRLVYRKDPRYFIAKSQKIDALSPPQQFLVLENGKGKRGALLPVKTFKTATSPDEIDKERSYRCEWIDLDERGALSPKSPEQCAVAAYLAGTRKNIGEAFSYLDKAYSLKRYSPEAAKILGWLAHSAEETFDHHPDAIALRSYAAWRIDENFARNPKSSQEKNEKVVIVDRYQPACEWESYFEGDGYWGRKPDIKREPAWAHTFAHRSGALYVAYLDLKKAASSDCRLDAPRKDGKERRLFPYQEISWLARLSAKAPNKQLERRSYSLADKEKLERELHKGISAMAPRERLFSSLAVAKGQKNASPLGVKRFSSKGETIRWIQNLFPRTRPGEQFTAHFLDMYEVATSGTAEEKKILLDLLRDMVNDPSPLIQGVRSLLELLLVYPESAKEIKEIIASLESGSPYLHSHNFAHLKKVVDSYCEKRGIGRNEGADLFHGLREMKEEIEHERKTTALSPLPKAPFTPKRLLADVDPLAKKNFVDRAKIGEEFFRREASPQDHEAFPSAPVEGRFAEERYRRLEEDYREGCRKNDEELHIAIAGEGDLEGWKRAIDLSVEESEKIASLLERVVALANKEPLERAATLHMLEIEGKKRAPATFSNLLRPFLQEDREGYRRLNPHLTDGEIEQLHSDIATYIVLSLDARLCQEKGKLLDKAIEERERGNEEAFTAAMEQLGKAMEKKPLEVLLKSPQLLLYHYFMDIYVRPDQVADIERLLGVEALHHPDRAYGNIALQKIMGAGKTLVIGTLLALLKADGYHLSLLVPPSSLYDTNAQDMQRRSEMLFGQKTRTLLFKRGASYFDERTLRDIYHMLREAIVKRESVIAAPESLQALENRYWEAREELSTLYGERSRLLAMTPLPKEEIAKVEMRMAAIKKPLSILKEILKIIDQRAIFTLDEIDVTLDARKELNFPRREALSLPKEGAELVALLFSIAATDREILAKGLDLRSNRQAELQGGEVAEVKALLVKKALLHIAGSTKWAKRLFLSSSHLSPYRKELMAGGELPPESLLASIEEKLSPHLDKASLAELYTTYRASPTPRELHGFLREKGRGVNREQFSPLYNEVMSYCQLRLLGEMAGYVTKKESRPPPFLRALRESGESEKTAAAELFVLLKQELVEWLELSWKCSAGENYGFSIADPGKETAIPYSYNNKPNERSEYADPWETVNRTLQLYLQKGLNPRQAARLIETLQEKARIEWAESGCPEEVSSLPSVELFKRLTRLDLLAVDAADEAAVSKFREALSRGGSAAVQLVMQCVVDEVIPQVKVYPEQITHNAQNLASMGKVKSGYSGTMESHETFPDDMEVKLDAGTNGKIFDRLFSANKKVHVVDGGRVTEHLKSILGFPTLTHPAAAKFRALVDIGPIYKGESSSALAAEILAFMQSYPATPLEKIKGVLYWDDQTNVLCCIKEGEAAPIVLPATDPETIEAVTGLKNDQWFAFYPHHKLTGADLVMPKDAYILTTISDKTPLRDLLQGDMRARGLFEGQHVESYLQRTILPLVGKAAGIDRLPEVVGNRSSADEHLSIKTLVPFAESNEAGRQEPDLERSTLQKMGNLLRKELLRALYQAETDEEEEALFQKGRHLSTRKTGLSLYEKYAEPVASIATEDYFLREADRLLLPLCGLKLREILSKEGNFLPQAEALDEGLKRACRALDKTIGKAVKKLPETIDKPGTLDWGREMCLEVQEESRTEEVSDRSVQEETEYQVELDTASIEDLTHTPAQEKKWKAENLEEIAAKGVVSRPYPHREGSLPAVWPMSSAMETIPFLRPFAEIFPAGLTVTENFVHTVEGEINLFDRRQKPIYELLAQYDEENKEWQMTLITIEEAAFFKEALSGKKLGGRSLWMIEPEALIVAGDRAAFEKLDKGAVESLDRATLPLLFLAGNVRALNSRRRFHTLKEWAEVDREKKRLLFENGILPATSRQNRSLYDVTRVKLLLNKEEFVSEEKGASPTRPFDAAALASRSGAYSQSLEIIESFKVYGEEFDEEERGEVVAMVGRALKNGEPNEKVKAKRLLLPLLDKLKDAAEAGSDVASRSLALFSGINDPAIVAGITSIAMALIASGRIDTALTLALMQTAPFEMSRMEIGTVKQELLRKRRMIAFKYFRAFDEKGEAEASSTMQKRMDECKTAGFLR